MTGEEAAHAVAKGDAVRTARPAHRAVTDRKNHGVALAERHYLDPRLPARALLDQDEGAAGEILLGRREQDGRLQRKDMLAIDVLVQAIIVAGVIAQQERRRIALAG